MNQGTDRIERIRALDARIEALSAELKTTRAERAVLGREECLSRSENMNGRRVRDPNGRVFELVLQGADVVLRHDGTVRCDGPKYGQVMICKDGERSKAGITYCYALDWNEKLTRGWEFIDGPTASGIQEGER